MNKLCDNPNKPETIHFGFTQTTHLKEQNHLERNPINPKKQ